MHKDNFTIGQFNFTNFIHLSSEQIEMVLSWRNDPLVRQMSLTEDIISLEDHKKFIESLGRTSDNLYWLASFKDKDLGVISLNDINWNKNVSSATLGMYSRQDIRTPLMGFMLKNCLDVICFEIFQLHAVRAKIIDGNTQSFSLCSMLGFIEDGRIKDFIYKDRWIWKDLILMSKIQKKERYEV